MICITYHATPLHGGARCRRPARGQLVKIDASDHFYFPVYEGVPDRILGVISVKDLWSWIRAGETPDLRSLLLEPVYLPKSLSALRALERLRESGSHLALVIDEYGDIEGLLTLSDILQAIIGELPTTEQDEPMAVQREDGSWLLDGMLHVSNMKEILDLATADATDLEEFHTLGGFVMGRMGHVPETGDHFEWNVWHFEMIDMDHRRVDKVLVARVAESVTDLQSRRRPAGPQLIAKCPQVGRDFTAPAPLITVSVSFPACGSSHPVVQVVPPPTSRGQLYISKRHRSAATGRR